MTLFGRTQFVPRLFDAEERTWLLELRRKRLPPADHCQELLARSLALVGPLP